MTELTDPGSLISGMRDLPDGNLAVSIGHQCCRKEVPGGTFRKLRRIYSKEPQLPTHRSTTIPFRDSAEHVPASVALCFHSVGNIALAESLPYRSRGSNYYRSAATHQGYLRYYSF